MCAATDSYKTLYLFTTAMAGSYLIYRYDDHDEVRHFCDEKHCYTARIATCDGRIKLTDIECRGMSASVTGFIEDYLNNHGLPWLSE